jgi:hypothetical protein
VASWKSRHVGSPSVPRSPIISAAAGRIRTCGPADRDEDVIIGDGDAMRYVMSRIDQVAPTDATVLLHGETVPARSCRPRYR